MNQITEAAKNKTEELLKQAKTMPQVECLEKHHFGPGLYIKEVTLPAGAVIIGKPHKVEHMCVLLQGKMVIAKEDGSKVELVAPMTFVSPPGRKVAYILETVVFQNIFATNETDVEKLENMFIDNTQQLLEEGN